MGELWEEREMTLGEKKWMGEEKLREGVHGTEEKSKREGERRR